MGRASNRAMLREVNAAIRSVDDVFGSELYHLLCECGSESCLARVDVPSSVYVDVLGGDGRHVVAPGHEGDDTAVAHTAEYAVVTAAPPAAPRTATSRVAAALHVPE